VARGWNRVGHCHHRHGDRSGQRAHRVGFDRARELTPLEEKRLATTTDFDRHPVAGLCKQAEQKKENIMRTWSRLMIAAGIIGTVAGTGATTGVGALTVRWIV
jgi:hypothetical protein